VAAHPAGDAEAPGGAPAGAPRAPALDGCRVVEQFGDRFVLVSLSARAGRATEYLTGAVRVDPGAGGEPAAAVLAVLDATNRWAARPSHRG
jgi:hypothetical protein